MIRAFALKLTWIVTVCGALVLLYRGLLAGIFFEPTRKALAEASRGELLIGIACLLLIAAAAYAALLERWPVWVAVGLLAPVVLCGGLTVVASGSLLPQLAAVVAYPPAVAAGVAGLVLRTNQRPPGNMGANEDH